MNFVLVAFKADGARKDFRVRGEKCVIGRRPEADLRIPSPTVSRQHCEIALKDGKATIRDLGSSNGTFLNEVRVREATLAPGDRLAVGPVVFVVQIEGQPAQIAPITSQTMPSASADPRSATSAPVGSLMDGSSMMAGGPAPSSDDSAVAPSTPGAPAGAGEEDADSDDPLSRMFSKSKKDEEDSSVFEFDFDDLDEDEKKKR